MALMSLRLQWLGHWVYVPKVLCISVNFSKFTGSQLILRSSTLSISWEPSERAITTTKQEGLVEDIIQGVARFSWAGRFETVLDGGHRWCLDAAHDEISMKAVAQWFADVTQER